MLVLSLFPGVGLLDLAFEEAGFCVVRGPDLLWGGDVARFHPPRRRFDGIIGGPPCQAFSRMGRTNSSAVDLIPEFERVVREAAPHWFLMENVPEAPTPAVRGYFTRSDLLNNRWVGGVQSRLRRFTFGTVMLTAHLRFHVGEEVFEPVDYAPTVLASGSKWNPAAQGKSAKRKGRAERTRSTATFREAAALQGLPEGFDLPPFTVEAKIRAVGNGVPLPMGRAVARAVKEATV